jgi:hypothetical protein
MLTMGAVGKNDGPPIEAAWKWAKLMYSHDIEHARFNEWISARTNSERTDLRAVLESIPLHFSPEELPPPLRRHFEKTLGLQFRK